MTTQPAYENVKAACGHTQRTRRPLSPRAWAWAKRQVENEVCGQCFNQAFVTSLPWNKAA